MSEQKAVRVREVMKTKFDVVNPMVTICDALSQMEHADNKCLIVNPRDDSDEVGLLLISDISRKVLAMDRAPDRVNVYEIMAKPVLTVDPEMIVRYCARLFDRFDLSRAPVVEAGKVIGIVSYTDLVIKSYKVGCQCAIV